MTSSTAVSLPSPARRQTTGATGSEIRTPNIAGWAPLNTVAADLLGAWGNAAVREGNFEFVRRFNHPRKLSDMEFDRTELRDLSRGNAPKLDRLLADYEQ